MVVTEGNMRERLDGWRAFRSEESLPTAPDTRTSVKDVGREPGPWHRNENHLLKMRWCGSWGLRTNGWNGESSWVQVGNREKDNSGISRLFLETHSRMPSLQESLGPFSPLMSGRKSLQEQKGAYVPHSH